jgi:hypothetical protein
MDLHYLIRRMDEERQRAAAADNSAARQAHHELAEHYAAQIERLRGNDKGGSLQAATA